MRAAAQTAALTLGLLAGVPAASAKIIGRCVYEEGSRQVPIPGAAVEARAGALGADPALDVAGPFLIDDGQTEVCARGTTNDRGWFELPDCRSPPAYVRCALSAGGLSLVGPVAPFDLYATAKSERRPAGGDVDFGDVLLPAPASALFARIERLRARLGLARPLATPALVHYPWEAERKLLNLDRRLGQGRTWPFDERDGARARLLVTALARPSAARVAHELGHLVQADAVANYKTELPRALRAGCGSEPVDRPADDAELAFAEGWAVFFEEAAMDRGGICLARVEAGPTAERPLVPNYLACRLWRLRDRHGMRAVVDALRKSRARTWVAFLAAVRARFPDADAVALPPRHVAPDVPSSPVIRFARAADPLFEPTPATSAHALAAVLCRTLQQRYAALAAAAGDGDRLRRRATEVGAACGAAESAGVAGVGPATMPAPPAPRPPTGAPRTIFLRAGMPPPERIAGADPVYPEAARQADVAGTVVVLLTIEPDGRVTKPRLIKDLPVGVGKACFEAVRDWRFKPYRVDGQPVRLLMTRRFIFRPD